MEIATQEMTNPKRIEWIDVFKGILIILVVVGHATGMFNGYIYQFHMAAFFFASGLTANVRNKDFLQLIVEKFYRLMVPFYFLGLCGILLFYFLNELGVLSYISTTVYPEGGVIEALYQLMRGNIYCDWLGALWFLPVLFIANIIVKLIDVISLRHNKSSFFLGGLVFVFAEYLVLNGEFSVWILGAIAQFYFMVGMMVRKSGETKKNTLLLTGIMMSAAAIWYGSARWLVADVMDWPPGKFNGALLDAYLPVWGILLFSVTAKLISKNRWIKEIFLFIGKSTMGIMCFHFLGFKLTYVFLIMCGKVEKEDLYRLTLSAEDGNNWWPLLVVAAVLFSIFMWSVLKRNLVIRILMGEWKGDIYTCFKCTKIGMIVEECWEFQKNVCKEMWHTYKYKKSKIHVVALLIVFTVLGIAIMGRVSLKNIRISFPD
ncbi:MAG: acyltransferase [Lachnospiraceae bacterium]|nr:acyltransferase [Lachnospiraceae bacterium]